MIAIGQQPGFVKLYAGAQTGADFSGLLWDGEKIITMGGFYSDTLTNGTINGMTYMELDTNGNTLLTDVYFEAGQQISINPSNSISRLSDGKIIILTQTGQSRDGLMVVYQNGERISTIRYEPQVYEILCTSLTELSDGLLITGQAMSFSGVRDAFLLKYDKNGNKKWEKHYSVPDANTVLREPYVINNNKIVIPGGQFFLDASPAEWWTKSWILTVDSTGTVLSEWESAENEERGISTRMQRLPNGNWLYATAAYFPNSGGSATGFKPKLVCRDSNFNLVWQRNLSEYVSVQNYMQDLTPTPDGNYIILGQWTADKRDKVHKFKPDGTPIWTFSSDCQPLTVCDNELTGVTVTPGGSIYVSGYAVDNQMFIPKAYAKLIKLDPNGCVDSLLCAETTNTGVPNLVNNIKIFPNPASDKINIANPIGQFAAIYDIYGKQVINDEIKSSTLHTVDTSKLSAGTYFVKMSTKNLRVTYKVVIGKD